MEARARPFAQAPFVAGALLLAGCPRAPARIPDARAPAARPDVAGAPSARAAALDAAAGDDAGRASDASTEAGADGATAASTALPWNVARRSGRIIHAPVVEADGLWVVLDENPDPRWLRAAGAPLPEADHVVAVPVEPSALPEHLRRAAGRRVRMTGAYGASCEGTLGRIAGLHCAQQPHMAPRWSNGLVAARLQVERGDCDPAGWARSVGGADADVPLPRAASRALRAAVMRALQRVPRYRAARARQVREADAEAWAEAVRAASVQTLRAPDGATWVWVRQAMGEETFGAVWDLAQGQGEPALRLWYAGLGVAVFAPETAVDADEDGRFELVGAFGRLRPDGERYRFEPSQNAFFICGCVACG